MASDSRKSINDANGDVANWRTTEHRYAI